MNLRSATIVSQPHNAIFTACPIDVLFCKGDIGGEIGFSGPAGSQSPHGLIQIALGTFDAFMGNARCGQKTPQAKHQSEPEKNT